MSDNKPTHREREPHELDGLKGICNYKGVNVMRIVGGFQVMGVNVVTPQEVDDLLQMGYESIEMGIERGNSVTVKATSGSFSCESGSGGT